MIFFSVAFIRLGRISHFFAKTAADKLLTKWDEGDSLSVHQGLVTGTGEDRTALVLFSVLKVVMGCIHIY